MAKPPRGKGKLGELPGCRHAALTSASPAFNTAPITGQPPHTLAMAAAMALVPPVAPCPVHIPPLGCTGSNSQPKLSFQEQGAHGTSLSHPRVPGRVVTTPADGMMWVNSTGATHVPRHSCVFLLPSTRDRPRGARPRRGERLTPLARHLTAGMVTFSSVTFVWHLPGAISTRSPLPAALSQESLGARFGSWTQTSC